MRVRRGQGHLPPFNLSMIRMRIGEIPGTATIGRIENGYAYPNPLEPGPVSPLYTEVPWAYIFLDSQPRNVP